MIAEGWMLLGIGGTDIFFTGATRGCGALQTAPKFLIAENLPPTFRIYRTGGLAARPESCLRIARRCKCGRE